MDLSSFSSSSGGFPFLLPSCPLLSWLSFITPPPPSLLLLSHHILIVNSAVVVLSWLWLPPLAVASSTPSCHPSLLRLLSVSSLSPPCPPRCKEWRTAPLSARDSSLGSACDVTRLSPSRPAAAGPCERMQKQNGHVGSSTKIQIYAPACANALSYPSFNNLYAVSNHQTIKKGLVWYIFFPRLGDKLWIHFLTAIVKPRRSRLWRSFPPAWLEQGLMWNHSGQSLRILTGRVFRVILSLWTLQIIPDG